MTSALMNVPIVTVGMPVFNGDQFLRKSIESVVNQSYRNIEIIISDNCSTDKTRSICLDYAARDKRIRYIRQVKNHGSINNFVFLLSEARGKYFMWAGADDFLDVNWINTLLEICEKHESLAFGVVQYVNEVEGKIDSTANRCQFNYSGFAFWRRLSFIFTPWLYGKMILCWGLFPRELLLQNTKLSFIPKWGGAVDSIWVYSILAKCNVISTPEVCLYKRVHQNAESSMQSQDVKYNLQFRFFGFLRSVLKVNFFWNFLNLSPLRTRLALLTVTPIFYPLYVFKSIWVLIFYKLNKIFVKS